MLPESIRGAFLILHHDDRTRHDAGRRKAIGRALITGISTGQGSARIADRIMQAAQIPERRALLIARTEINRAYRQSNPNRMRSSRAVLGYRRMCYPDTACFACPMLDKEFYPIDSEPCDHPNGKCSFVPVTRHYDPGNDPGWQGGREYFDSLPEDAQRKLMGPGRFDLWKQGGVDPRDMVYIKPNQTWGGSPAIKAVNMLGVSGKGEKSMRESSSNSQIPDTLQSAVLRPENEPDNLKEFNYRNIKKKPSEILSSVNPLYGKASIYNYNCQRCVVADEAQWRGYDVEALPYDPNDPIADSGVACWDIDINNIRSDPGFKFITGDIKYDIIEKFNVWGDDARAVLRIEWANGGGHFLTIRKENGNILFEDPQDGSVPDIDTTIASLNLAPNHNWLMRVDNRKFSDNIKYAIRNR